MRTCIGNILLQRLSPETSSKKELTGADFNWPVFFPVSLPYTFSSLLVDL